MLAGQLSDLAGYRLALRGVHHFVQAVQEDHAAAPDQLPLKEALGAGFHRQVDVAAQLLAERRIHARAAPQGAKDGQPFLPQSQRLLVQLTGKNQGQIVQQGAFARAGLAQHHQALVGAQRFTDAQRPLALFRFIGGSHLKGHKDLLQPGLPQVGCALDPHQLEVAVLPHQRFQIELFEAQRTDKAAQ